MKKRTGFTLSSFSLTYSGSKDAELINDYIKKGLIVPGEITINLLLKKIRVCFSLCFFLII